MVVKGLNYEILAFLIISSLVFQLQNYAVIDFFFSLISIGIVFGVLLLRWKNVKYIWPFVLVEMLFYYYVWYNTIANEGNINTYGHISMCLKNITLMFLLVESGKMDSIKPFKIIAKVFFIIITLNFIQLLLFPTIMGTSRGAQLYLMSSNYNQFGGTILAGCLPAFVLTKKNSSLLYYLILLVSLLTVIYCGSVTTSIGILLLIVYFLAARRMKFLSKLAVIIMLFILTFVFMDFILSDIKIFGDTSLLEDFLNYTGKDPTFSGRTKVWARAILVIQNNSLMGIGLYVGDLADTFLGVYNSHNIILDLLLVGGVVLFLPLILLLVVLIRKMHKHLDPYYYYGMIFIFEVYLLMMQFEIYSYYMIFLFIFIMYYSIQIPEFRKTNT